MSNRIADTPEPPYVAVIFTSLRSEGDQGYAQASAEMGELAARQPGYLGVESARDGAGLGITVSYWSDEAAARGWKQVAEHLIVQRRGREAWYREYRVRVAAVAREYGHVSQEGAGDSNARTIAAYDQHAQRFIDGTTHEISGRVREWLGRALAGMPRDARILELGSAFGRDAGYLQELGYQVECTDATPAFVDELRSRGFAARPLNAITDELPGDLDVVLANAVLLHFTRQELALVAAKVHSALRPGGRFAFTVRQGTGEEWTSVKLGAPRFFCYWNVPQLRVVIEAAGFEDIVIRKATGVTGDWEWLHVVAGKSA